MKMVKSLLLGAAAGLVAVSGAQAADLPVKAKPVQYVKICSLYGAGFFYIPGTDTCLKIGGYARSEWLENAGGSFNPSINGANAQETRAQNSLNSRSRFLATFDVRSQTEYGTLRAYTRVGFQWTTGDAIQGGSGATLYVDRAFIQLGGWTFGKTESFYNISIEDFGYTLQTETLFNDTGGSGVPVLAYTAQFGNGLSATLSMEDHFENQAAIFNIGAGGLTSSAATGLTNFASLTGIGGNLTSSAAGVKVPDLVANLRVDQAWGTAQINGALHNDSATYYLTTAGYTAHPSDSLGGAIGAGLKVNLPMLGKGDSVGIAANWCDGAVGYCANQNGVGTSALFGLVRGGTVGVGWIADAAYNSTNLTGLELSRAWNVNGGIQHYWAPNWSTSLWGVYFSYKANSNAIDTLVCPNLPVAAGAAALGPGCEDYSAWQIGSRTTWTPVTNLDISVEAMYTKVKSAESGTQVTGVVGTASPLTAGDVGAFSGVLRFQRNFWP
jgi:hypothetical protein